MRGTHDKSVMYFLEVNFRPNADGCCDGLGGRDAAIAASGERKVNSRCVAGMPLVIFSLNRMVNQIALVLHRGSHAFLQ